MPALIQRHGVVLIAGIIAAGADGAFAVADLQQEDSGVNDRIPVGEVCEGAEGGAGMVELAHGTGALCLAQQRVIGLHAGIGGLVIEGGIVPGDNAGGVPGVHMAGAAGPGHFVAAQGDDVRLAGVEGRDLVLELLPDALAVLRGQAHVVQSALGVGSAGLVEIVGVVGEGRKVHIGALGQILDILQSGIQAAGAVGIGGVGVQLAEVQLELGLTHGEAPDGSGFLAVGTGHGDSDRGAAVRQVFGGRVGNLAVFVNRFNGRIVDLHGNGGVLPCVADVGGDDGTLVVLGFRAGSGRQVGNHRLVLDHDPGDSAESSPLAVITGDGNGQGLAGDQFGGNGVAAVLVGDQDSVTDLHGQLLDTEHGVHGKGEGVFLAHIGFRQSAEHHGRCIHNAAGQILTIGHGIELEGVDGIIRHIVHAVGLVGISIVLQILAEFAVVLGGAALHGVAIVPLRQGPVGVLGGSCGIERVVAGAVGAQVAIGIVDKAEVIPVLLDLEYHAAIFHGGLTVGNGRVHAVDGGALHIVILGSQNTLGGQVVDHHRIPRLGQTIGNCRLLVGELIEVKQIIIRVLLREGREHTVVNLQRLCTVFIHGIGIDHMDAAGHSLDVPQAVVGGRIGEGQAVAGRAGGQVFAVGIGEGILAIGILCSGQNRHVLRDLDVITDRCGGSTAQSLVAGSTGHHQAVLIVINHKLVAVLNGIAQLGVLGLGRQRNLICQGVPQLERCCTLIVFLINAECRRDIHNVTNSVFPDTIRRFVHNSLVQLNGVAVAVLDRDVGVGVFSVIVVDLRNLHTSQFYIGADIGHGQSANGGLLGCEGQAGGFLIGAAVQLGQTIINRLAAGANDGIAQRNIRGPRAHANADAAGGVLNIDIGAIHQGHDAFDGEGAFGCSQCIRDLVVSRSSSGFGNLTGRRITQLQRGVVNAHCCTDVHDIANSVFPNTLSRFVHNSLVQLNGVAIAVLNRDVGVGILSVIVEDLRNLHTSQFYIGADIGSGQSVNGGLLGREGQAGGFLIGAAAQLGQTVINRLAAGANDGIAQRNIRGLRAHADADAAGGVLDIDIGAIHQGHDALDGEGAFGCSQCIRDRRNHRLFRIGSRIGSRPVAAAHLVDAGQQHGFIGIRSIVQESGSVYIIQNAAAGRIRTGNCRQSIFDRNRPGSSTVAGIVHSPCGSCIQLAVDGVQRPGTGVAAQGEYLNFAAEIRQRRLNAV